MSAWDINVNIITYSILAQFKKQYIYFKYSKQIFLKSDVANLDDFQWI